MGLRKIEEDIRKQATLRIRGSKLAVEEIKEMIKQVRELQKRLEQLERKHSNEIKKSPELAKLIMELREELGLPRHLGIGTIHKKPGFLESLTGRGSYYEYLALQILELGRSRMKETGGIISIAAIISHLVRQTDGVVYSLADIIRAIEILQEQKLIARIRELPNGIRVVEFNDLGLTNDHEKILELAAQNGGELTREKVVTTLNWTLERATRILEDFVVKNAAYKKNTMEGLKYYFPGI